MLEETQLDSPEGEFIEFARTGSYATGEFHCSSCGYGIAVSGPLPQCPMCAGTTWEPGDTSFILPPR